MPAFTTFTLENKSSYDPLQIIYDSNKNIKIDWGDGVIKEHDKVSQGQYYSVTDTPLGNTIKIYGETVSLLNISNYEYGTTTGADQLIGVEFGYYIRQLPDYSFCSLTNLKFLNLGCGINTLGYATFCGCASLSGDLIISSNVTTYGGYSNFEGCGFKNVYFFLGNLVKFAGSAPLAIDMPNLEYLYVQLGAMNNNYPSGFVRNCPNLRKLYIKCLSNVLDIGSNTILDFSNDVQPSVEEIIIEGCNSGTKFVSSSIINSRPNYTVKKIKLDNVLITDSAGFAYNFKALEEVEISGSIMDIIQDHFFYGCSSLKKLVIPSSVTQTSYSAFQGSGLEHVIFEGNVVDVRCDMFTDCTNLKIIEFLNTYVPPYTFDPGPFGPTHLDNIEKIILPSQGAVNRFSNPIHSDGDDFWAEYADVYCTR